MSGRAAGAILLASVALTFAFGGAARADGYKDDKLGFSIAAPSKWKQAPLSTDERWIVAKFQSNREWEFADKANNYWTRHTPYLDVVVIPIAGTVTPKPDDGDKQEDSKEPLYKDLKTYLDKTLQKNSDEGFFFDKEEESQVNGLKVVQYQINIEKNVRAPKRVYAWAFYSTDAIYGVVGESLVQFEDKVKPELVAAFKSLKVFPRTGKLPGEASGGDAPKDAEKKDLTDAELKARRDKLFSDTLAKIKGGLPDGWTTKDSEHFTAVSHADAKYTGKCLEHAEALRAWLDESMGFVGSGYCGKAIIRICQDQNELDAFRQTNGWNSSRFVEIVTYKDKDGWGNWAMEQLNRGVLECWQRDRNAEIGNALPAWLARGFSSTVECAASKGSKIEFRPSRWDLVKMMELRRANKLLDAKSFFTMTRDELWGGESMDNLVQADAFTRFLLIGSASKSSKYKNVLSDYVKALVILVDEENAKHRKEKPDAAGGKEPQNEEEEAAMNRARQEEYRALQKEWLQKLVDKTFPGWDQKEWDKFNALYWKELGV